MYPFAKKRRRRRRRILLGLAVLLGVGLYGVHIATLKPNPQQTLLFGPTSFLADSTASLRIIVQNKRSGQPIAGAHVAITATPSSGGKRTRLLTGRTNAYGTLEAPFHLANYQPGDYNWQVKVRSRVGKDVIQRRIKIKATAKVLLTTDKPRYQPGQTLHLRALALRQPSLKPAAGEAVTFQVEDPQGNRVFKRTLQASEWGIAAADFTLADKALLGRYTVQALLGDAQAQKTVAVERYTLPKFQVEWETDRTFYQPGQLLRGTVKAHYFFGKPVGGGEVKIEIASFDGAFHKFKELRGWTDGTGTFVFKTRLPTRFIGQPLERGDALLKCDVSVLDRARHLERIGRNLTVAAQPLRLEIIPESGDVVPNVENIFYLVASYPDGTPARTWFTLLYEKKELTRGQTDEQGLGEVRFVPPGSAPVFEVRVRDERGYQAKFWRSMKPRSPYGASEPILLRPDQALYRVGDTVHFDIFCPTVRGCVYFDVVRDGQTILTRTCPVENGRGRLDWQLSLDCAGTLSCHAYVLRPDGSCIRDTRTIFVQAPCNLQVQVSADRNTYQPGGQAKLHFAVRDGNGKPTPAALGVNIVDESIFALEEQKPGLARVYFLLEEAILKPRIQIKNTLDVPTLLRHRQQRAAQVWLATVQEPAGYDWQEDTYAQKQANAEKRREMYFDRLRAGAEAIILAGLLPWALAESIHEEFYDRPDRALWVVLIGVGLGGVLLWGAIPSFHKYRSVLFLSLISLAVGLAILSEVGGAIAMGGILLGTLIGLFRKRRWLGGVSLLAFLAGCAFFGLLVGKKEAIPRNAPMMEMMGTGGLRAGRAPGRAMEKTVASLLEPKRPAPEAVQVRQFFPETLFSDPSVITDEQGQAELTVPLADSITSWRLTALASSKQGELGSVTRGLRVFQDFFIDLDLPVALTQGDEVAIPVTVYNYLKTSQRVRLVLETAGDPGGPKEPERTRRGWFELLDKPEKIVTLEPHEVKGVYFRLKAIRLGRQTLTVFAHGPKLRDAIRRSVDVLPNGKEFVQVINGQLTLPPPRGGRTKVEHTVCIPPQAIDGASTILVKVYPSTFSQIVTGLEALLAVPFGCFEQTSSVTYPNVLVLDYLRRSQQVQPEIEMQAEQYINLGYQRLLTFEVRGGGFDWYRQPPGKNVLSAYGLLELHDLARVYPIDERILERTRKWLLSRQQRDGSWKMDYPMHTWIGINDQVPVTAYVVWSLAETGLRSAEVQRGLDFLRSQMERVKDPYTLALCANAFVFAAPEDPQTRQVLSRLNEMKKVKEETAYWESSLQTVTYSTEKTASLETTALAAYAMAKDQQFRETVAQALTYLIQNKDERGGWHSTQATILALKALVAASAGLAEKGNATLEVALQGRKAATLNLTGEASEVTHIVDLKQQTREGENRLTLRLQGSACPSYQIVGRYYLPWSQVPLDRSAKIEVQVDYDRTRLRQNDTVTAHVTVRCHDAAPLYLVIVELGIPPGFQVRTEDLATLKERRVIQNYELTGRQIIIYLGNVTRERPVAFAYRLAAQFPIRAQVPPSVAYAYYNPETRSMARPVEIVVTRRRR